MGLNMPAKTVVFTAVQKYDGKEMRNLTSGEYIQMSGRAGRRGLDERGVVMLMTGSDLQPDVAKTMLMGEADRLNSAFHLSYNMLLNLMRLEGIPPEFMLERCFFQFQNNAEIPQMEQGIRFSNKSPNDQSLGRWRRSEKNPWWSRRVRLPSTMISRRRLLSTNKI